MTRARFIEVAPDYYAIAVVAYLRETPANRPAALWSIQEAYKVASDEDQEPHSLLGRSRLLKRAIDWLIEAELISVIEDAFADDLYDLNEHHDTAWSFVRERGPEPFITYSRARESRTWLFSALNRIEENYEELQIADADFDEESDVTWDPILPDPNDPKVAELVDRLEATIEQVRVDNGYSATYPAERDFVLDSLSMVAGRLRTGAAVSVAYLRRYAIESLDLIRTRFGPAALGLLAQAAKDALIEFVKEHGVNLLRNLFS